MSKRPRAMDASDTISPTRSKARWSLRRMSRRTSNRKESISHENGAVSHSLHSGPYTDIFHGSPSSPPRHHHHLHHHNSNNPHRNTSTVAREVVHGLHSFVTTGRMHRPIKVQAAEDPHVVGIRIEDLAFSSEDAFQLGSWTTTPDDEYESTLRIRDEYIKISHQVKDIQMEGIGREQSSSEISHGSDSTQAADDITLEDMEVLDTLGTGSFGRVLLVRQKGTSADDSNNYYAMKVLNKSEIIRLKQVEHINSERSILSMIDHPFIVNLHCTFQDSLNCYMLMEFVIGGEIFHHLRKANYFTANATKFYMACLILAIKELHSKHIIYRDMKPENLLIDADGYVKMTDFGFSKQLLGSDRTWTLCGTPEYLSPEVILSQSQSFASDYWCLGILMYEMLVGHPPFFDSTPFGTYHKIIAANLHFPQHVDPIARNLISSLLTVDVSKRLGNLRGGANDVMNHAWFFGLDWQALLERRLPAPFIPHQNHPNDTSNFEKYADYDISNMPAIHIGIQADQQARESDPWKHLFMDF